MRFVPWPGFGPFESYDADHTVAGGERLELAGLEIDVLFTPGHSPGPRRPTRSRPSRRSSPATCCSQGSIGRTDLPGGDAATLMRSLGDARRGAARTRPSSTRATWATRRSAASAPRTRSWPSSREPADPGTARHVRRAGRAGARARRARGARARGSSSAPATARIETPAFEATELFARGVGESTDVVQKEMYTFADERRRVITLRPEGTAPVCRAYLEHGMHKLPQPVKLWYLSSFFRRERPQKGRFRQFWQVGVEAIGSDDPAVDAESILLLAELLEALGAAACGCGLGSLGTPRDARALPRRAAGVPARARGRARRRGRRADRPQPAARVRLRPPPARAR